MTANNSSSSDTFLCHKNLGNQYFKENKFDEAIKEFTTCLELDQNQLIYSNRSAAYAQLKKYNEALSDAEKCIELDPNLVKGYSRKGLALFHLGRLEESIKAYQKGLELDPNNEPLKSGLAAAQKALDELPDAATIATVTRALLSNSKLRSYATYHEYVKQLASIFKQIQSKPENLKIFLQHPDPKIREGLLTVLGMNVGEENDDDINSGNEAEKVPKKEPEPEKKNTSKTSEQKQADEWKEKGNAAYKKRDFEEAHRCYDEAIKLCPNDLMYQYNKSAVYLEQGEYDKCLQLCNDAIERRAEMAPDFRSVAKVYNRMASCYMRQKRYAEAINMYQKSLVEHNDRDTRDLLKSAKELKLDAERKAYINPEISEEHRAKGNELFKQAKYPEAVKEYDEAIKRNPSDAKIYSNRAAALMKLLEYPSALNDLNKCLKLDPKFVRAYVRKGNLHAILKEYHKAVEAYDAGLKIEPENAECKQGKYNVMMKISKTSRSGEVDEEQLKRSMNDPEIQQILTDPQFRFILSNITENPALMEEYMKDPAISSRIQKLVMAGVLRVG